MSERERAYLTSDLVVFAHADILGEEAAGSGMHYLAVLRRDGKWALPGGHLKPGECDRAAAVRECREETGVAVPEHLIKQVDVYRAPHRDHRGRYVSFAWTVGLTVPPGPLKASPEVARAAWRPIESQLDGFDHMKMLEAAESVAEDEGWMYW